MWKNILAYSIVSLTIASVVGSLGYAFYMGGWKAFFIFCDALGIMVIAIGFGVLIIWAFCYVFKS